MQAFEISGTGKSLHRLMESREVFLRNRQTEGATHLLFQAGESHSYFKGRDWRQMLSAAIPVREDWKWG